jgi:hypothetical protein
MANPATACADYADSVSSSLMNRRTLISVPCTAAPFTASVVACAQVHGTAWATAKGSDAG